MADDERLRDDAAALLAVLAEGLALLDLLNVPIAAAHLDFAIEALARRYDLPRGHVEIGAFG